MSKHDECPVCGGKLHEAEHEHHRVRFLFDCCEDCLSRINVDFTEQLREDHRIAERLRKALATWDLMPEPVTATDKAVLSALKRLHGGDDDVSDG